MKKIIGDFQISDDDISEPTWVIRKFIDQLEEAARNFMNEEDIESAYALHDHIKLLTEELDSRR